MNFAQKMSCMLPPLHGYVHNKPVKMLLNIQIVEKNSCSQGDPVQKEKANSMNALLERDIMEAVWSDMALTELPSWVTDVPRNWGTKTHGN